MKNYTFLNELSYIRTIFFVNTSKGQDMRLSFNYEFIFKQILQIPHKSVPLSSCSVLKFRNMRRTSFLRYHFYTESRHSHVIPSDQISGFTFPHLIFFNTSTVKRGDHRLCTYFGFNRIGSHTYEITLSFLIVYYGFTCKMSQEKAYFLHRKRCLTTSFLLSQVTTF